MTPLPRGLHLWCTNPDELTDRRRYEAARSVIAPQEAASLARHHFEVDRRAFLATRALVRMVLSRYADVAPADWSFAAGVHGRPSIAGPVLAFPLHFNLSRTQRLVACAVTPCPDVGVDAEFSARALPQQALGALSSREAAALRALPVENRAERFFEYWTLKESYVKARGLGLSIPMDRLNFVLSRHEPPRIEIDHALNDDESSWSFTQMRPTLDHLVALCVRNDGGIPVETAIRWYSFGG